MRKVRHITFTDFGHSFSGDVVLCAVGQTAPGKMRCAEIGCEDVEVERGVVVEPLGDKVNPAELHRRRMYVME